MAWSITNNRRLRTAQGGAAAFFLIFAAAVLPGCSTPQAPMKWGPPNAALGATFTLEEMERKVINGQTAIVYRLKTSGLPEGRIFTLLSKPLDSKPTRVTDQRFYATQTGKLLAQGPTVEMTTVSGSPPIDIQGIDREFLLTVAGFAKAEPLRLALIDMERTITVFAKTIPFPIETTNKERCRLWLELGSRKGDVFAVFGEGFKPDEEISTVSKSGAKIVEKKRNASAGGLLLDIIEPGIADQSSGRASYSVMSRSCVLTLNYDWGTAAQVLQ